MSTAPPKHEQERLAEDWLAVSIHEAGHAVLGAHVDLPIYEMWLAWREHRHDWSVQGRTEVAANSGTVTGTADQEILFVLGGLEAEALQWTSTRGSIGSCRRYVRSVEVNKRGDLPLLECALRDRNATLDERSAEDQVHRVLMREWRSVERLAEELRDRQSLSEREIRRYL